MGIFYSASAKELLQVRNRIFLDRGVPVLTKNKFVKSPFSTSWFGKDNLSGYTYDFCRLTANGHLETLTAYIVRGDNWIKLYLNIFELKPIPDSIDRLKGVDGLKFSLPPNSATKMRLRSDDIKGVPLFNYDFWFNRHKINKYYSRGDLESKANQLGTLIEKDLQNINSFIRRWHEMHLMVITSWKGAVL